MGIIFRSNALAFAVEPADFDFDLSLLPDEGFLLFAECWNGYEIIAYEI